MNSFVVSTGWCPSHPPRTTRARRPPVRSTVIGPSSPAVSAALAKRRSGAVLSTLARLTLFLLAPETFLSPRLLPRQGKSQEGQRRPADRASGAAERRLRTGIR